MGFRGAATLTEITGEEPSRVLTVAVAGPTGSASVRVVEGVTLFDNEGDLLAFADLLAALVDGTLPISVEGDGEVSSDGSVVATSMKVETAEDGAGPGGPDVPADSVDLGGIASLTGVSGEAPTRTLHVTLTTLAGSSAGPLTAAAARVACLTTFDNEGDILSFADLLAGLGQGGHVIRIEGDGSRLADGSVRADAIKVEIDN